MPAFLQEHQTLLTWLAGGSAIMLFVSLITLPVLAVVLPADFLRRMDPERDTSLPEHDWRTRHPVLRITLRVLKNLLGIVMMLAGIAMLVLPGQGLVTMAFALVLLDFPGKRKLERRILHSPRLIRPINRLRVRFGKEPLEP